MARTATLAADVGCLSWRPGWREAVEAFVHDLELKGYSGYTLRDYRTDVMRLGAYLDVSPPLLRPSHLEAADRILEAEGLELSARRRRLSAYRRFMDFLQQQTAPPLRGPELTAAIIPAPPEDRLLAALVYLGGFRLVEIAPMEGRDVRLRKDLIITRHGYRMVPLHPALKALILEIKKVTPFAAYRPLLPGPSGFPVNARTLHSRFQKLVARAGFPDLKPDTLRQEVALFLRNQGTPPGLVRTFLGKDRGRPLAPRRGRLVDLNCLRDRLSRLPT